MTSILKIFREFLSPLASAFANVYCVATSLYAFLIPSTPELNYDAIDLSQYFGSVRMNHGHFYFWLLSFAAPKFINMQILLLTFGIDVQVSAGQVY